MSKGEIEAVREGLEQIKNGQCISDEEASSHVEDWLKKISWTPKAIRDRFEILEHWSNRNKSKTYSRKLYQEFASIIKLFASNPQLGKSTEFPSVKNDSCR